MTTDELATHQAAVMVQRYRRVAKPTLNALGEIIEYWSEVVETKGHHVARQYLIDVTEVLSAMTNSITLESKQ